MQTALYPADVINREEQRRRLPGSVWPQYVEDPLHFEGKGGVLPGPVSCVKALDARQRFEQIIQFFDIDNCGRKGLLAFLFFQLHI